MPKFKYRSKRKKLIVILSVILFFLGIWLFLSYCVNPILTKISEEKVKQVAITAVNNATQTAITDSAASYENLIKIEKNSDGEIQLMQVNSYLLNVISRQIASLSQTNITQLGTQGIGVPIGSLSGLTFLAGRGPDIKIRLYPVGSAIIDFESQFISAGINQTKHRINLKVTCNISVVMPGLNRTLSTYTDIPLCETIIIGKVPDTYLNSTRLTEMLNLIP